MKVINSPSFEKGFFTIKPPALEKVWEVFVLEINHICIDSVFTF